MVLFRNKKILITSHKIKIRNDTLFLQSWVRNDLPNSQYKYYLKSNILLVSTLEVVSNL